MFCWYLNEPNPFKACSCLPLSELVVLQVNSTEAENQTGKSKSSHSSSSAKYLHLQFVSHTPHCHAFYTYSVVWGGRLQEEPDLWIHQLGSLQLHMCSRLLRRQVWRYFTLRPGWCSLQAAGQVESRLGYLKRSCAIPQEFGALPWKRLLWWWIIVIIKTDTASPSLLREPVAWCCE